MTERSAAGDSQDLVVTDRSDVTLVAWGIKASFLRYVAGVGGDVLLSDGAVVLGDSFGGGFGFPVVASDGRALSTRGEVHFRAHYGLLDVRFREVRLVSADGADHLTLAADGAGRRLTLATAAPTPSAATQTDLFQLHADAVVVFDGTYPPGTALDPVRFFRVRA
jgi:hypothetical protein